MKFIENQEMEDINSFFRNLELGSYRLNGRVQAFQTSEDEEILTDQESNISSNLKDLDLLSNQRSRSYSLGNGNISKVARRRSSSLGDLNEPTTRKLLLDLINTLSDNFPDYYFGNTKLNQFVIQNFETVVRSVNSYLAELTISNPSILSKIWNSIDQVVDLRKSEIFLYIPDMSDEMVHSKIWSFHYFFFNKSSQRLSYFTCNATW